jgi:hypothetical protein
MIDILAQASDSNVTALLSGAGGAGAVGTIFVFLVKRQVSKIADHVDNEAKHIPAGTTIVSEKTCNLITEGIKSDIVDNADAIAHVHERIDVMMSMLAANKNDIVNEIQKLRR